MLVEEGVLQNLAQLLDYLSTPREDYSREEERRAILFEGVIYEAVGGDIGR